MALWQDSNHPAQMDRLDLDRLKRLTQENQYLRARLDAARRTAASLQAALEQQRHEAMTDALTGLYNRRAMDQRLSEIWAVPDEAPLALLVLDIDYFKRINDTFGHADGDCVIRWVAATLCRCIRTGDSAFRYGGEEFVALLPETGEQASVALANRLREMFANQTVLTATGEEIRCTVSIGVSRYVPGDTETSLIRRADDACYSAKGQGKNCVVLAGLGV